MRIIAFMLFCVASLSGVANAAEPESSKRIAREVLEDKIRGGWAGQMIGVTYGAPTEFTATGRMINGNPNRYRDWKPERIAAALEQDDLYVDVVFAGVMDRHGLEATPEQYAEALKNAHFPLWHANGAARRLLLNGVPPSLSGDPKYNVHANDIDFQIESDFIGLMAPGLPRAANYFANRVGRVMNWGDGLYGGMFVAGMYAAAYFESDPRKVVERGLLSIPKGSHYARVISDVLRWSEENPDDWTQTWKLIEEKWNRDDSCPQGAGNPLNIDASLNGAYVVLGLLYGHGDFERTLDVSVRAGQDSDCNPSTAAGVLGVMLGYSKIPEKWRAGLAGIADKKFSYTSYTFDAIAASTVERAEAVVRQAGGKVTADALLVPEQKPAAPPLEQWDMGRMRELVPESDSRWTFSKDFQFISWDLAGLSQLHYREASAPGATATLRFTGTGLAIIGLFSEEGGLADVLLDGKPAQQISAWSRSDTFDTSYWHITGLKDEPHELAITLRPDADPRSIGRKLQIVRAVVYQ